VHLHVKSDSGFARSIDVIEVVRPPTLLIAARIVLVFLGASYLFYWIIKLAGYLVKL
jgi:hypothetical protein